jgi:hypothetical protein
MPSSASPLESYMYEGGVESTWPITTTTLTADISSSATSIPVANASRFVQGQLVRVGAEWVRVASIAGNTLKVDRAQAGTAAAAGKAGAAVRNAYLESSRDVSYSPLFRIAEQDQYALWQQYFHKCVITQYSLHWVGYKQWGFSHWLGQLPGRGDGRDGRADNRRCLATPGLPGSKGPTENQDARNVSVRMRALIEWNQMTGHRPPGGDERWMNHLRRHGGKSFDIIGRRCDGEEGEATAGLSRGGRREDQADDRVRTDRGMADR